MAQSVLTDAYIYFNSTNYSDWSKTVTINYAADALDDTAFGDDTHSKKGGLKDWSIDIEMFNDYADNDVDEDVFALIGTTGTIEVRPAGGDRAATNPGYNGTCLFESYQPIKGNVGEMAGFTLHCVSAGTLSRSTA